MSRKPETGNRKPEWSKRKPETGNRKPEWSKRKPETGNLKPEWSKRKPETGNLKPEWRRKNSLPTQVSGLRSQVSDFRSQVSGFKSGLTLVEVMLALAILGIGLTILISTASKCLAVVKQSRNYESARHFLALVELDFKNKVLELEEGQTLEDGSGDVTFPESDQYKGTWEVATEGDEEDGLKKVTFRVAWSEHGANPYEEAVTYLYVPQEKKGGTVESR